MSGDTQASLGVGDTVSCARCIDLGSERVSVPAAGDYVGAFFGVGYGDGADGGSVPEGFGFGLLVVDGVVGGLDGDAG